MSDSRQSEIDGLAVIARWTLYINEVTGSTWVENGDHKGWKGKLRHPHRRVVVVLEEQLRGAVSDVARARGLAEALATCRDDAPLSGVREVGAEIAALLTRVGGQSDA